MAKLVQMANTFNSVLSAIGFSFGGDSGCLLYTSGVRDAVIVLHEVIN